MPTERGEAIGEPEEAAAKRPHRGQTLQLPTRFPGLPSGCSWTACPCSGRSMAATQTNVQGKRGPAGPRHEAARGRSEHRNGAHLRRLQLAGDGEGCEERHEPGLLDWPTPAADVDRDAGL